MGTQTPPDHETLDSWLENHGLLSALGEDRACDILYDVLNGKPARAKNRLIAHLNLEFARHVVNGDLKQCD